MSPIAVFLHGLFSHGDPREIRPAAFGIITEEIELMNTSGLTAAAKEIHLCFNGSEEERCYADLVAPEKATITMHGDQSFAENLTIVKLWEWSKTHPGWYVLYFHAKGATHQPEDPYSVGVSGPWRRGMLKYLVANWRECCNQLAAGHDVICCHWMWNMADGTQHIPAGNFLWLKSEFAAKLPSMHLRQRIIDDGIAAASSRYEAEVFWGFGPRPNVFQWLPRGGEGVP